MNIMLFEPLILLGGLTDGIPNHTIAACLSDFHITFYHGQRRLGAFLHYVAQLAG